MENENVVVALYENNLQAKQAIKKLQKSGYDLKKLSVVGKEFYSEEHVVGYYNTSDRMTKWGAIGAFWGSVWGLLFGSAYFIIPGVGPLLMAGPLVASFVAMLEGAAVFGGLSALGAVLIGIGVPKDSVLLYETEVKAGKFLIMAHGSDIQLEEARKTLGIAAKIQSLIANE